MASVASGGTADRIAARILFKVLRAGSGTPARYSSTFFGAPLPFAAELRLPDFTFFMRAMLQEPPLQVHAPDHHAAVRHEKCHSFFSHTFTCPYSRVPVHLTSQLSRPSSFLREARLSGTERLQQSHAACAHEHAGPVLGCF